MSTILTVGRTARELAEGGAAALALPPLIGLDPAGRLQVERRITFYTIDAIDQAAPAEAGTAITSVLGRARERRRR